MDSYIYKQPASVDNKDSPKKRAKNLTNKDGKKDGGVLSLLGKKKKPARQKKPQELKRQSHVLATDSSAIGKRYGSVDSSPTSPPWRGSGRGSVRTSVGSCPNSPMMTGYQGPKGNMMSKSAFEAFWNGPEPLFDPTKGPKEYKKDLSPESEIGNKDLHLKPGGSPEVHRIQLRVSSATPPPRAPPVYQNADQLRSPPPKPKHTIDHNCAVHSAAGHHTRYKFPSPGVSPEIQRSNSPNTSRQSSQDSEVPADAPKSTATSVLPDHYKYLSDYTYSELPPKPRHTMPQQFIVQDGVYSETTTERVRRNIVPQQYVAPDEIYSKAMPEKLQKNENVQQCDTEGMYSNGSPEKGRRSHSQQLVGSEGIFSQGSPERDRHNTMSSSSHSSPESPRAQIIRASQHIHSGSGIIRRQHSLPTPGNSPEIQRILRSCPPPEDSPSPPTQRARSAMDEGIYYLAAPVQVKSYHHGSLEDIKGGYSSEPDTIVWRSNNSNYSAIQSRTLPQKPPSSGRRQEQHPKNAPRKHPRRHTVGGATLMQEGPEESAEDSARKKEAFMELLAKRYPQYRDKISGTGSEDGFPIGGRRTRDPARRATVVTYNPGSVSGEYEDSDTMSNIEGPVTNFTRGGYMRSSLPIVRSPPNTYERPMGFVFLIYREETRRAVLPNEITHLDTVRAMFVRAFPQKLNLEILESPRRKIYVLEAKSSIYYQLEDLRDIRDRSVLKIHECDSFEPQKIKEPAPETRGKLVQPPAGQRGQGFPGESPATAITDHVRKAQTMPPSMAHSYPSYVEMEYERPRSQTPDPIRMSKSQGTSSGTYGRVMYQSPERQLSLERPNLRPIPENHQMQNGYIPNSKKTSYDDMDGRGQPIYVHLQGCRSQPPPGDPLRRAFSPPPSSAVSQEYEHFRAPGGPAPGAPPQTYVAHGTRASNVSAPQRATGPGTDPRHAMHNNRHSLAFTPMADKTVSPTKPTVTNGVPRSQSYRVAPDTERSVPLPQRPRSVTPQPVPPDVDSKYDDWFRMDKMEAQIANLAAWVQTAVVSTNSSRASSVRSGASTTPSDTGGSQLGSIPGSLSDLSTASQTTLTPGIKEGILNIKKQTTELRSDLRNIRRLHQLNKECMQESIQDTLQKITKVLSTVPGTENQVLRKQRSETDVRLKSYIGDKAMAFRELGDLESCVEELRFDVLSRHCLVNMTDVEGMALLLSQVARCLGELKGLFPSLQEEVKHVLSGEMEVVVKEEKFLKDEPDTLEEGLKRCKKLTNTLFTLKRLASVQEHRPHQKAGQRLGGMVPTDGDRKHLLENITALVPDHDARLRKLEEADASRERKKKIVVKQEALKFGRSLEMATRSLKPASSKEQLEKGPEVMTALQGTESQPSGSKVEGSPSLVHKPTSSSSDATVKSSSLPPSSSTSDKSVQRGDRDRQTDQSKSETRPLLTEKSRSLDNRLDSREAMVSDMTVMRKPAVVVSAELPSASKCLPVEASKPHVNGDKMASGKPQLTNGKGGSSKRSKSVDSGALEDKDVKRNAEILRIQKNAARANFFSSITTPPTSPEEEKRSLDSPSGAKVMDYTVRISPVKVTVSGETQYTVSSSSSNTQRPNVSSSSGKPTFLPVSSKREKTGETKSATPSPTTPSYVITPGGTRVSSIPRISPQKNSGASVQNRDISEPKTSSSPSSKDSGSVSANGSSSAKSNGKVTDKVEKKGSSYSSVEGRQKRPPPPPPPRKSSSRPGASTAGPLSPVRTEGDPQDSSVVTGHRMGSALNVGTLTSTPKAGITHKPTTKFEKDLAGGKSVSNLGNNDRRKSDKTDSQLAKSDKTETPVVKSEKLSPATAPVTLKFEDTLDQSEMASGMRREERESSSESTTSSSSLDSQQGTVVLRCTGKTNRKPKPPPPARRSSLPLGNNPPTEKMYSSSRSKVNGRRESDGDIG
ncbi:serine/arginine repetitive matrix protein 2-like isoform X3 [Mizuhopecten yessoensis]|uniref:serine/arginine repetitive matrix protein 2-like isoform X3 n=1 Tax=Mizuhopecten yessoensis TaxID=6573 RepID=UPI000B45EF69|nr:serine/arginine repetitive matrix protein 2-like isoform X3 [Mizuhopecten yessoensis]